MSPFRVSNNKWTVSFTTIPPANAQGKLTMYAPKIIQYNHTLTLTGNSSFIGFGRQCIRVFCPNLQFQAHTHILLGFILV